MSSNDSFVQKQVQYSHPMFPPGYTPQGSLNKYLPTFEPQSNTYTANPNTNKYSSNQNFQQSRNCYTPVDTTYGALHLPMHLWPSPSPVSNPRLSTATRIPSFTNYHVTNPPVSLPELDNLGSAFANMQLNQPIPYTLPKQHQLITPRQSISSRKEPGPNLTLEEVLGNNMVKELAVDQHGSRFLQQEIADASSLSLMPKLVDTCLLDFFNLSTDQFGNYVIQKLITTISESLLTRLVEEVKSEGIIVFLTNNLIGCRVIQKILEVGTMEIRVSVVEEFTGHEYNCITNQNGNHVIQKCFAVCSESIVRDLVRACGMYTLELSCHRYGCRVIQKCIEECRAEVRKPIMDVILLNITALTKDPFGNYIIQHILLYGSIDDCTAVIMDVADNVQSLAGEKFSSNVVEKCLNGPQKAVNRLIQALLGPISKPEVYNNIVSRYIGGLPVTYHQNVPIVRLSYNQFGNYVVQKVLKIIPRAMKDATILTIKRSMKTSKRRLGKHMVMMVNDGIGSIQSSVSRPIVSEAPTIINHQG